MFMQSTTQFQQATQASLQANSQAIAKLEIQMGQLATLLSEREKGKFPSKPIPKPKGQFKNGASSYHEQAKSITTLRSGKVVDNHVGEPMNVDITDDEDKAQDNIENISKSQELPTSTFFRNESIPAYIP